MKKDYLNEFFFEKNVRGGYLFVPKKYEFWQGDSNRLDSRILFRKVAQDEVVDEDLYTIGENGWIIQTLSPWTFVIIF